MKAVLNNKYACLDGFINELPHGGFDDGGLTVHHVRNVVRIFVPEGEKVVVKKFRSPNAFNRIMYTFFRGSKAERACRNAVRLHSLNVNTPEPIGYIDMKEGGLIRDSYLVTAYTDWRPIQDFMKDEDMYRHPAFVPFVKFTISLHEKGICHNDYNLTNVLYHENGNGGYDFALIDINRMKFCYMSASKCISNIKRMCANSDIAYNFIKVYADLRGWSRYRTIARLAIIRTVFEQRNSSKKKIKHWVRAKA